MKPSSLDSSKSKKLCLDASVLINLLATGYIEEILQIAPFEFFAEKVVLEEVTHNPNGKKPASAILKKLMREGLLIEANLGEVGQKEFFDLCSGSLATTLGDGESATIALAFELQGIAVIDDKKATKVATNRYKFSSLIVASTLDLLTQREVVSSLKSKMPEIFSNALKFARMSVPICYENWLKELIGEEEFVVCPGIRLAARLENNSLRKQGHMQQKN